MTGMWYAVLVDAHESYPGIFSKAEFYAGRVTPELWEQFKARNSSGPFETRVEAQEVANDLNEVLAILDS